MVLILGGAAVEGEGGVGLLGLIGDVQHGENEVDLDEGAVGGL